MRGLLNDEDLYIDLLPQRTFLSYAKQPGQLRAEILAHHRKFENAICVVDEIQKIPSLLDEVHELIESIKMRFILTGSSARKLKREGANLLAGRAYTYHLFPLTYQELGSDFEIERALHVGTLPILWESSAEDAREFLRTYVETYLKEEVAQEGLVRNIAPFAHFLDVSAAGCGETVNYSNLARECGVSVKTAQQYYQILEDTFLAFRIPAWTKSSRRRLSTHPRYYFFDTGVTNALNHVLGDPLNPVERGRRFEQFFVTQLLASIHYSRLDFQVHYWKTNHGAEVDFLICKGRQIKAAVEVKSAANIASAPLNGLRSFLNDNPKVPAFVVGIRQKERKTTGGITVLSWDKFLSDVLFEL